jgi:hypothetical protein
MEKDKTMRTIKKAALTAVFSVAISMPVMAADWDVKIKALTATYAENRISFGQRSDATDGFDGKYDVPAFIEGDISAYFPHTEWTEPAKLYWRDIKAPDLQKSWLFTVESVLNNTNITLSWDSTRIPQGFTATLVDNTTGASVDMTSLGIYTYTNTGPRQFVIQTEAPLDAPSQLNGWVVDNTTVALEWVDNSTGEEGFIIERRVKKGQWTVIAGVGANVTTYTDYTVDYTSERMYVYRVKAYSGLVESDYSNVTNVKPTKR